MTERDLDQLCVNTIRFLAADAVQQAKSGHPGLPMGAAPMAYVLWTRFLRHHPADPAWPDRDRFVLSAGHGSMLLYALAPPHGLRRSRSTRSSASASGARRRPATRSSGSPRASRRRRDRSARASRTPSGMAIAERHLAARFNRPGHQVVDHHTYVLVLGRRPHGRRGRGGGVARRASRARQADRALRRQPGVARRARRRCPSRRTCRGGSTGSAGTRRPCPTGTTWTRSTRRSGGAGGDGAPVPHRRADHHRLRRAEEGRDPRGPRRAAGRCRAPGAKQALGWPLEPSFLLPEPALAALPAALAQARAHAGGLADAVRRLGARVRRPRDRVATRPGRALPPRLGPGPPALSGRTPRWRRATRAERCSRPSRRACRTSCGGDAGPRPVHEDARQDRGLVRARHARGPPLSTSACASTRWGRSPTASRITGACSSSAAPSSSSRTTCVRRCGWPRSRSCRSSYVWTHDSIGRRGGRADARARSSTWPPSARCRISS